MAKNVYTLTNQAFIFGWSYERYALAHAYSRDLQNWLTLDNFGLFAFLARVSSCHSVYTLDWLSPTDQSS